METGPRFIVSIRRTGEARDRTCDDIFVRNADQFNSAFSNAHRTLYHLKEVVHNASMIMNSSSFKHFIDTTNEYVVSKEHTLMSIYSMLSREAVQDDSIKLKYFSFEVDTREQALHENIDEMIIDIQHQENTSVQ